MHYRLSRYGVPLTINGKSLFYHSLTFDFIVLENDPSFMLDEGLISIDENSPLLKEMVEKKIVSSVEEDAILLQQLRAEIREPYVSTAYLFITKNCNLACSYCFEKQSEVHNSSKGIMTCQTLEDSIHFFSKLIRQDMSRFHEKKTIIFYGGEPFHNKKTLYYGIQKVQEAIDLKELPDTTKMIIVTNGTLLGDEDIQFIKEKGVTLTFSLDGDREASVNRIFPDGKSLAWEKATETFKKCKAAGIDLNVACTLTPQTLERSNETLAYFIHEIGITNIGFNLILDNEIIQLNPAYDDLAADFVTTSYFTLAENKISENRTQRRIQVFARKHPCLFDCNAAGGRQIAIAPDGEVGICHEHIMDQQHFVTNIYEDFRPSESPKYQKWKNRSPLFMDECQSCTAIGVCGGGCVINTERKFGTIWKPDERFCKQTLSILNRILLTQLLESSQP